MAQISQKSLSTTKKTTTRRKNSSSSIKPTRSKSSSVKKMATKKRSSTRKYSPGAQKEVEKEMRKMKQGTAVSGRSGKRVTSREQAIAIGLSKARKKGMKVPSVPKKNTKSRTK